MTEKIQFFMTDLAHKLGIGEIKNIHVAEESGRPVLRIECEEKKASEYKTVTAKTPAKKEKKSVAKRPAQKDNDHPILAGVGGFLKDRWNDKRPPAWMR